MPNRIIKESICASDSLDQLSWFEECFFYRLIVNCDDFGRMDARPAVLKARLFPLKDRITLKEVSSALTKLASVGCVSLYLGYDGKPYLHLPAWEVHQTIRAKRSKYPDPEENHTETAARAQMQADASKCKQTHADVPVIQSNPIQYESENARADRPRLCRPTVDEVAAYCAERGNSVDAANFCDFYAAKGWEIGKEPMKDWKAAVRTWERRDKDRAADRSKGGSSPQYKNLTEELRNGEI
jgi:hypothetical protein